MLQHFCLPQRARANRATRGPAQQKAVNGPPLFQHFTNPRQHDTFAELHADPTKSRTWYTKHSCHSSPTSWCGPALALHPGRGPVKSDTHTGVGYELAKAWPQQIPPSLGNYLDTAGNTKAQTAAYIWQRGQRM